MNVATWGVTPALRDSIARIAVYDGFTPDDAALRMLPSGTVDLVIPLEGRFQARLAGDHAAPIEVEAPALLGPQVRHSFYGTAELRRGVLVTFQPGRASRFLPLPVGELRDCSVDAELVFGSTIRTLADRLRAQRDPAAMMSLVETYLRLRFTEELNHSSEIDYAVEQIRSNPACGESIVRFAEERIGFCHKHFVSLFKHHVGLSPKCYQRLVRFNRALRLAQSDAHPLWREIASRCGYSDQSHLANDFRLIAGLSPRDSLRALPADDRLVPEAV